MQIGDAATISKKDMDDQINEMGKQTNAVTNRGGFRWTKCRVDLDTPSNTEPRWVAPGHVGIGTATNYYDFGYLRHLSLSIQFKWRNKLIYYNDFRRIIYSLFYCIDWFTNCWWTLTKIHPVYRHGSHYLGCVLYTGSLIGLRISRSQVITAHVLSLCCLKIRGISHVDMMLIKWLRWGWGL